MTGAERVVSILEQQGIKTIFGYPGGAIMPIYDALYGANIEHVLCRHEQGAAMAAIGLARSTQQVAVCMATSGPGATNLITGLADAFLDSVPLIAITGQVASSLIGTDAFQEIDVIGLSLACTKHSYLITDISELESTLLEAFFVAQNGRPGPVLVDIAKDVQLATLPTSVPSIDAAAFVRSLLQKTNAIDASTDGAQSTDSGCQIQSNKALCMAIAKAQGLLDSARQPVLYVGGGVQIGQATKALREFLTTNPMPSVSTLKGLGTIERHDPNYLGMLGMHGTKAANLVVQQADLLLVVGARFDDRVTGKLDTFAQHAKVIHIDIDAAEIDKLRRADAPICCERIADALAGLKLTQDISVWLNECQRMRLFYKWRYDNTSERIFAPQLLKLLSDLMPDSTIIATDVGQHQMWAAQHVQPRMPQNFLTSAGLGTMGFGLPAAMGAWLGRRQDTCVLITGDGSFMMNVQELATLKRRQIPVKIIILDNQRLGMVRQWQSLFFEARYSETVLDDNPDFVLLAKAFDIDGQKITKKTQILPAINQLLASENAYLLHVVIHDEDNVWPLVPPGASNHDMMEST